MKCNLREILYQRKMDMAELSKLSGLSLQPIKRLYHEQEWEGVQLKNLIRICEVLDIKLNELVIHERI